MRRRSSPAYSPSNEIARPASYASATASAKPLSPVSSASAGPCWLVTLAGSFAPGQLIVNRVPSALCAPTSTTTSTPISASVLMHSRKATGSRAWRRQYAPSGLAVGSTSRPVVLLIRSIDGGAMSRSPNSASRSSSAGSTRALWYARLFRSCLAHRPSDAKRSTSACTSVAGPLMTCCAPLSAAMFTSSPAEAAFCSSTAAATRCAGANTAAIAPSPGSAAISRLRRAVNRIPSSRL